MLRSKSCIAMVILALLIGGGNAMAKPNGSVFIGAGFPTGDFKSGLDGGWTAGGYLTASVTPIFELGGTIAYTEFTSLLGEIPIIGKYFGEDFDAWEFHALGQANIIFLRAFLGMGWANHSGMQFMGDDGRRTDFSWQLGMSANFLIFETRLSYHSINLDETSSDWGIFTIGLTF